MITHKTSVKHVIILFFTTLPQLNAALGPVNTTPPEMAMPRVPMGTASPPAPRPGADTPLSSSHTIGEQGNWVKKRKWLEQALAINKQIQDTVIKIQESRTVFQEKKDSIDGMLDTFYQSKGLIQGELNKTFDDTERYIAKKKEREIKALHENKDEDKQGANFDYQILEIEDTIKQLHAELEQLKLDIKSIEALDNSLSDRLKTLDLQIGTALTQSSQSRMLSEKIWYLIDDNKARDVFYQIKALEEQGKNILTYVHVTLKQDFENVIEKIKEQIKNVTKEIEHLEAQGLIIQNRSKRVEELRAHKKAEEAARLQKESEEQEESLRKKNKKQSSTRAWYMQPLSLFSSITSLVTTYLATTYHYFFGTPSKSIPQRKKRRRSTTQTNNDQTDAPPAPLDTNVSSPRDATQQPSPQEVSSEPHTS